MGLIRNFFRLNGMVLLGGAGWTVYSYPELRREPYQLGKALIRGMRCLKGGFLMTYDYLIVSTPSIFIKDVFRPRRSLQRHTEKLLTGCMSVLRRTQDLTLNSVKWLANCRCCCRKSIVKLSSRCVCRLQKLNSRMSRKLWRLNLANLLKKYLSVSYLLFSRRGKSFLSQIWFYSFPLFNVMCLT